MTNFIQPTSLRKPSSATGSPLRGSLKSALAILVLLLLGLLIWQLVDQYRHTQADEYQHSLNASAELADHMTLNMSLKAQVAQNTVQPYRSSPSPEKLPGVLARLQTQMPNLQSVAWLDAGGNVLIDSLGQTPDRSTLDELLRLNLDRDYLYSNSADNRLVYLLLRQPGETPGYWLLRMGPAYYAELTSHLDRPNHPLWLLENSRTGEVINRHQPTPGSDEPLQSVMLAFLDNSTWQLRGLFDAGLARQQLLPALVGKCLLGLFCALLPLLALYNMRRRHRVLHESRRRYHDIFEGTGVALCVLDLSGLATQLERHRLNSRQTLQQRMSVDPALRRVLLQELKVTEVNQVALQLLGVNCCDGAWQCLVEGTEAGIKGIGVQLLEAVLDNQQQLELEVRLPTTDGQDLHLWLMVKFPVQRQDYQAVILSISDITSRKQVELSLLERESFWSDVVRTVPDQLYVQDVQSQRMIFSNRHLGHTLGYDRTQLAQMGERFWEILLHPDDAELYQQVREQQRAASGEGQLHCQLRFRHHDQRWCRFDIREQALTRDDNGVVTRIIGVGKDVTE